MHIITYAVLLAAAMTLTGCYSLTEYSKFDLTSEQMTRIKSIDQLDRDEFKVDTLAFLAEQLSKLENQLKDKAAFKGAGPNSGLSLCKEADPVLTIKGAPETISSISSKVYGSSLVGDPVIEASLATALMGIHSQKNVLIKGLTKGNSPKLGFAQFESFRRKITDAVSAGEQGIVLPGVDASSKNANFFVESVMLAWAATGNLPPSVVGYLGAYYRGKFVDRFGNSVDMPSFENGIDDGTISNFFRVLIETGVDSVEPYEPALETAPGKYYGKENVPTFLKYVQSATEPVASNGMIGISEAESRLIETGSNFIAQQGLTFFGGLLEFLGSVNIGFVVAPNFTIGSNNTLKTVARTVIETALRRGAERGIYCLAQKYNLDDIAKVIRQ